MLSGEWAGWWCAWAWTGSEWESFGIFDTLAEGTAALSRVADELDLADGDTCLTRGSPAAGPPPARQ
jgi:hypothetical protein